MKCKLGFTTTVRKNTQGNHLIQISACLNTEDKSNKCTTVNALLKVATKTINAPLLAASLVRDHRHSMLYHIVISVGIINDVITIQALSGTCGVSVFIMTTFIL